MQAVHLSRVATAFPPYTISQPEAALALGHATHSPRQLDALARLTQIDQRAISFAPAELAQLGRLAERNQLYKEVAPRLAAAAAYDCLRDIEAAALDCLVTSSCTGYMIPGLDVELARRLQLRPDVAHLPITEAG